MDVEQIDIDDWRDGLPPSGFEPFHTPDGLSVLERHAPGQLHLYGGYKGDHLVALMPLFVRDLTVGRAIFSPPPSMGIPRLGPLVMPNSPKRRSQEKVNNRFVEGVLEDVDAHSQRTFLYILAGTDYEDPRPFTWEEFDVEPNFTYRLPVDEPEEVLSSFSKSLRKDIRTGMELDMTIEREGVEGARIVYDLV